MKRTRASIACTAFFLILSGCANPGIVRLSPNTYMLSKEDHAGIFGSQARMQADVIGQANAFAESQGKIALPVSTHATPVGVLGHWATFSYEFRLVDKNDPDAQRAVLLPRPDVVVSESERVTVDSQSGTPRSTDDVYTRLVKLDDLRKKGIISDDEFNAQKKKILEQN